MFYYWLLEPPVVDGLAIEAPVAADLESGDALLLEQAVDRRGMDTEIIRELSDGQNWTSHRRLPASRAALCLPRGDITFTELLAAAEACRIGFRSKFQRLVRAFVV